LFALEEPRRAILGLNRAEEMILSLSIDANSYAYSGAQTNLQQGTAAIVSWLNGLQANPSVNSAAPAAATSPTPNVTPSYGTNSYSQFRSLVSAATTAQTAPQAGNQNAGDYQQAVAAYNDN
jgi:hypothetical protein